MVCYRDERIRSNNLFGLNMIASSAALDLDSYIGGRETDLWYVKTPTKIIGEHLNSVKEEGVIVVSPSFLLTLDKIYRKKLDEVSEYVTHIDKIYSNLSLLEMLDQDKLKDLRNFCCELSLHSLAMKQHAQQKTEYHHPFKT